MSNHIQDDSIEELVTKYIELDKAIKPLKKEHSELNEEIKRRLGKDYGIHRYGDVAIDLRRTVKTRVNEAGLVDAVEQAGLIDAIITKKAINSEVLDDYVFRGVFPYEKFSEYITEEESSALYVKPSSSSETGGRK